MELRQLRYFAAVAQQRHFTAAAASIGVAQPALSQQIKGLEHELGLALFDRSGRRVRLTEAGTVFLSRAERILAEVERGIAEMAQFAGLTRGRVIIGVLPSLAGRLMPPLLAGFRQRYSGLELTMREASSGQLRRLVELGEVDVALLHPPPGVVGGGVTVEPLFVEELVAAMAPGHRLAGRPRLGLSQLRDEPLLLSLPGSGIRQAILAACVGLGFSPRIAFESGGISTLRALAAAGLGVAILPRSEAEAPGPPIITRPVNQPALSRTVALVWPADRAPTAAARALLEHIRVELTQATAPPWRAAAPADRGGPERQ